jgi:hypothetical protein
MRLIEITREIDKVRLVLIRNTYFPMSVISI